MRRAKARIWPDCSAVFRAAVVAALAFVCTHFRPDGAVADAGWRFCLRVHMPADASTGTREGIEREIVDANALFAPAGIEFRVCEEILYPREQARVRTSTELGLLMLRSDIHHGIDVFFVDEMTVFPGPDRVLGFGAPPGRAAFDGAGLVAVVISSPRPALGHELGHYFGLEHQGFGAGNPMAESGGTGAFTAAQVDAIKIAAGRYSHASQPPSDP